MPTQPGGTGVPPRADVSSDDFVLIAQVDRPRGLVGEVVVTVHADDPGRMAELGSVLVPDASGEYAEVAIEGVKRLGARAVIKLAGYGSPEEARTLVGKELFIRREASTSAPPGRYYAYQLQGLTVRLQDGSTVGRIRDVLKPGAQSLLVVEGPRGELLIPMVRQIVVKIDLDAGTVTLDPPDGLLELNAAAGAEKFAGDSGRRREG